MLTIGYLKLASTLIPVLHSPLTFDPLASSSSLPSCWGNPADVGACDYDYQWKPVPQNLYQKGIKKDGRWTRLPGRRHDKLRVLYLKYREDYLSRAYRYFYDEIEVASTHPSLDVRLWGPGFYGYDESKSLDVNIKENFGSNDFFQVVYTSAYGFQNFNLTQSAFVYSLGDCHDFVCRREIFPNHDVLAFRYAFEPMDLFRYEQVEQLKKERSVDFVDRENWFPLMYHSNECSLDRYFYPATPLYDNETWADSRPVDVFKFNLGSTIWTGKIPFLPIEI